ncbi:MAG TPA: GNAT family protein [Caulobacteraceae bacterium]|jgi:RimJ/RimL family protein N-acetyltransferase|nr:GNAT family protein [Caulobacteraceae bacterium]
MPDLALQLQTHPLEGRFVRLEPYAPALKDEVRAALDCDSDGWDLFATSGQGEHFEGWWSTSLAEMGDGRRLAYAVRDLADGRVVGTSAFLDIRPPHRGAEIGATFLRPEARSGRANPEAKLLMLAYAFDHGAVRVELVTDLRNLRSQAAIAKLGAVREGVLRRERITWTGHVRDSVIYAITDGEWPLVRAGLERRLAAFPSP